MQSRQSQYRHTIIGIQNSNNVNKVQSCLYDINIYHQKQSTPSSRRSTTPHQPGGDLHLLMTEVAWRRFTAAAPGSATAKTLLPLPAFVMKLTSDFSLK